MAKSVEHLVEERLGRWRLESRLREEGLVRPSGPFVPANVIAIVEAYGVNGAAVADQLGERLRVPVLDHEIVEHIASTAEVRVETVELLDRRAYSAIDDYLTSLTHEKGFDQSDYYHALIRTVTALWGHGAAVFLGHGVVSILPRAHQLAVSLTAPRPWRIARVQEVEGLSRDEAKRKIDKRDQDGASFFRRHFHTDILDIHLFDLVLNREWIDAPGCASIILDAYRQRFGG